MGIASMVLGIISIFIGIISFIAQIIPFMMIFLIPISVTAIVLGIISLVKKQGKGKSIIGIVLGSLSIVLIIIAIIALCMGNTTSTSTNINNKTEQKVKKNPYEVTTEYDGIYSFLLLDNNGNQVAFDSVGAIEINNGNCNIKYKVISKTTDGKPNENVVECKGFAGKNKDDNGEFYIKLQKGNLEKNDIIYKCKFTDNKLLCELISKFNLSGCYGKTLELIKDNDNSSIDTVYNKKLEEENVRRKEVETKKAEEERQAFISSCQTYTFEQMSRNPDNFKGSNVKVTGEVIQALYGTNTVDLRVNITKKGTYSTYYTDTIYVTYTPSEGEDKILEDDIITIYGTSQGDYSYTSTIGSPVTLPLIFAKYITIEK